MKRTLCTLMFLTTFGMALAGPPVDYQLVCGAGEDATVVGVASLVDDELHVSLVDGALEACEDGVYGVRDGEAAFTVSTTIEDGVLTDVQVAFDEVPENLPTLSYQELPEVAVAGKLGAQENRAAALERATRARERDPEHAGGPPMDVPGTGDDGEEDEVEADDEGDGPPADLPAPANHGRR